ncbi:MAG: OmpA family protein [Cyanobacteria bacterium P01_H01_bin.74]
MARKKKHPEHENLERWLVSYADFMTLLFATFTALYALAQTDASKLRETTNAIREGFEEQSIMHGIKSVLSGMSPPTRNPDPLSSQRGAGPGVIGKFDSMTYRPGEIKSIKKMAQKLSQDLKDLNQEIADANKAVALKQNSGQTRSGQNQGPGDSTPPINPIEAAVQERGIRISFDSRLLFKSGDAALKPAGQKFIDKVAKRLKDIKSPNIRIEGHTDSQPLSTFKFASNWELSAARSSSVVRHLIANHAFLPSSLAVVGYGATQPIGNNKTAEGRAKNRRVDIILYNQKTASVINPRLQYLKEKPIDTKADVDDEKKEVYPLKQDPPDDSETDQKPKDLNNEEPKKNKIERPFKEGPVKVIIRDQDGIERVFIPKVKSTPSAVTKPVLMDKKNDGNQGDERKQ